MNWYTAMPTPLASIERKAPGKNPRYRPLKPSVCLRVRVGQTLLANTYRWAWCEAWRNMLCCSNQKELEDKTFENRYAVCFRIDNVDCPLNWCASAPWTLLFTTSMG